MALRKRKANTAARKLMVYNPAGGRQINGSRRRKATTTRRKRRNPATALVARSASRKRNPARRTSVVRNPAGIGGLLIAGLMSAVGVTIIDLVTGKVLPAQSQTTRIVVKLGSAYAVQTMGSRIPVIGKYNKEIALVLAVAGFVDLLRIYAVPVVNQAIGTVTNLLPAATQQQLVSAGANDGTTQGITPIQSWQRSPAFYA
jgi:hypothetical protein